jgi:alanine dehydrogenase
MKADEIILLSASDVQQLLTMDECIAAVENAFRLYGEGKAQPPAVLGVHTADGGFHVKAGTLQVGRQYFAAKVNGNFPENPQRFDLPTIQGVVVLCDAERGNPLAVMDSREITSLRTAAASAVAAKYLARRDSKVATICGCGEQGRVHLLALSRICALQQVLAYDQREAQAAQFVREMKDKLALSITAVSDLAAAVRQSDVCVTCTTSRKALLGPDAATPGLFIAAVGADNPVKQEIEPALMAQSKIVADILDQCVVMGDLHHALEAGAVQRSGVHGELGEVVAGKKPGRESEQEIIVFDSTGTALQDVAAAAVVYEKAVRQNLGVRFNLTA